MSAWPRILRPQRPRWMRRPSRRRPAPQPRLVCANWRPKCAPSRRRAPTAHDLEALERTLTVLEEKLFAAFTAAAPEELLVALKEHAARELAPYRSRMGVVQLRQVERQFVQKQLLVHYNLPRLSLFYMSQQ